VKPISKPTPKGDSNQKKEKGKESKLKENKSCLEINSEYKISVLRNLKIDLNEYNRHLEVFCIANDMNREEKELKKHFFNWIKQQELITNEKPKFNPYG
jgi:hypothetical protein